MYSRVRVGRGGQIGVSVVQVSLPSELDNHLSNDFFGFALFGEAALRLGLPRMGAFDINLISGDAGVAIPGIDPYHRSDTGADPFLDLSGPGISGGTVGGFNLGGSFGGELMWVGRQRY